MISWDELEYLWRQADLAYEHGITAQICGKSIHQINAIIDTLRKTKRPGDSFVASRTVDMYPNGLLSINWIFTMEVPNHPHSYTYQIEGRYHDKGDGSIPVWAFECAAGGPWFRITHPAEPTMARHLYELFGHTGQITHIALSFTRLEWMLEQIRTYAASKPYEAEMMKMKLVNTGHLYFQPGSGFIPLLVDGETE